MLRPVAIATFFLFAADQTASAQEDVESVYVREYKLAESHTFDCFGAKEDSACLAMIEAYERAMNAPDATEAVRHFIFKNYIHAIAVYGANTREQRGAEASIEILEPAYGEMMEHFDNGKHFHTLIDNLRLQQETAVTLTKLGRFAEADSVLSNARRAGDRIYDTREKFQGDENKSKLLHAAYLGSEVLETEIATVFRDRALDESKPSEAEGNRERAIAAYQRAEQWLRRKLDAGVRSMMDVRYELRLAEIKLELGVMLMNGNMQQEAAEEFLTASALSCTLLDPEEASRFDLRPAERSEVYLFTPVCERATLGWGMASGKADKIIAEAVDRMIQSEIRFLQQAAE